MKTQEELRAEFDRLFEAEDYEAAGKVRDLIEPISDEEWLKIFADAPETDELPPEWVRERSRELDAVLAKRGRRAG